MPNVVLPIPNIDSTVTQAVAADLANQVKKLLGLDYVNEMVFIDEQGNAISPSSFHGATNVPNDRYARFGGDSRIWIEATEEINENGWAIMVIERDESYPFFVDSEVGVNIQPIPLPHDMTLRFKFRTPNKEEAVRWRNSLTSKLARIMEGKQHSLTFSMNLSPALWNLLMEIHELRETKAPYNQTFLEYVQSKCSPDLTLVAEASGEQTNLSFRRRLGRVNGRFKVSPIPDKPAYSSDGSVWECVLEYVVTYDKPIECRIRYPIMVHNNFLPKKYIADSNTDHNPYNVQRNRSISQNALHHFEFSNAVSGYQCAQDAYIHIPTIDDFVPQVVTKATATVFMAMLQIDDPTERTLLNLRDLGSFILDEDILEFIQKEDYKYLNKPFKTFFGISFYRDQDLVHPESLAVDENLNVISSEDLDLRKTYRVRLYLVVDPCLIPHDAYDRLNHFPKALVKYVCSVNEAMRHNVDFTRYALDRPLEPWMLSSLWRLLNGMGSSTQIPFGNSVDTTQTETKLIPPEAWYSLKHSRTVRTVQISSILVHRRS